MSERKSNRNAVFAAPDLVGDIIKAEEGSAFTGFRETGTMPFSALADFPSNEIDRSAKRN